VGIAVIGLLVFLLALINLITMKKFAIKFNHTVAITYVATVEANTKSEAEELFNENSFGCGDIERLSKDSLDLEIIEVKEEEE